MLSVMDLPGLRPTTDRIRETLFNWLGQDLTGLRCLDLFAGTGAYALESLSRGAKSATCVDLNAGTDLDSNARAVAKSMQLNLLPLKIIVGDATKPINSDEKYDVVFADPPWDLWETRSNEIVQVATQCANSTQDVRVILEAPGGFDVPIPTYVCKLHNDVIYIALLD